MNEYQTAAADLAAAIAGFRLAERNASQALVVAECELHNLANRAGLRHLGLGQARLVGHDITGAPIWR